MIDQIAVNLIRFRLTLLCISLIIVAMASINLGKLTMDMDYKVFFDPDYPELVAYEELESNFSSAQNAMFIIDFGDDTAFSSTNLTMIKELTDEAWTLPFSMRVDSVSNFQWSRGINDDLVVSNLFDETSQLTALELEQIKNTALAEPLLKRRLISDTGRVAGINVTFQIESNDQKSIREIMHISRELKAKYENRYPGIEIYIIGVVPMNFAFTEISEIDSLRLLPVMSLIIIIILALLLRSFMAVIATLLVLSTAVAFTLGVTILAGFSLNTVSAVCPIIILTLAVADSVHLLTSYFSYMRNGRNKIDAMTESLKLNIRALFITSITTALGFLTLNFAEVPPLRHLGNMSAIGVLITFLLCIFMTPALMLLFSRQRTRSPDTTKPQLAGLADFTIKHRNAVFIVSLVITTGLSSMIFMNELNDENIGYFHPKTEIRQAADFSEKNLGALTLIEYSLSSGEEAGINEPEFLRKVEEFTKWYRAQPGVIHVYAHSDIMKRLNQNMHGEDPSWYRLPEGRELASQYLLLYEMSLPFGLDLNNQINVDKSAVRFTATLVNYKANELIAFENRAQAWLADNSPGFASVGSSPPLMFAHIGQQNMISMMFGTMLALLFISVLLMFFFRSVKYGLLSLLPNIFPPAIVFGVWGYFVGEINFAAAVVCSITLGIVVDDTVHFMTKYLRAKNQLFYSAEEAIRYAFANTGHALLITSTVLASGFLVLSFAYFDVNATLGKLISATIVAAIIFDFLFLPTLLLLLDKKLVGTQNKADSEDIRRDSHSAV